MRLSLGLLLVSLVLAVAAGVTYRAGVEQALPNPQLLRAVPELPFRFAREHQPLFEFSLARLSQWEVDPILVDTAGSYPQSRQFCCSEPFDDELGLDKLDVWHSYATCGEFEALPETFFLRPPFLHLSGHSFVRLAFTTDPERFGDPHWLANHKQYLRITELDEAARLGVSLSESEKLVTELREQELDALLDATALLLGQRHVLVARVSDPEPAATIYGVYRREDWERFVATTPVLATPNQPGEICLAVVGTACFNANPRGIKSRLDQATVLGTASLAVFVILVIMVGWRRARDKRREQEARLFVLQTLSHEIRTPATSLALSLEPVRRHFDDLPAAVQPAFLRICDNVQRLQRVVEASKQYLRGQLQDRDIQFNRKRVPALADYLAGILESYNSEIALRAPAHHGAIELDPYWVAICVRNLLDNALAHGEEPVALCAALRDSTLTITVQDGGKGPRLGLGQLTIPFCKGPNSQGLGFGLAVVHRLMAAMGGQLRFESQPTRFSIVLTQCCREDRR